MEGTKTVVGLAESVCPVCLAVIPAQKVLREDGIYLEKTCPAHGFFTALIWEGDARSYRMWSRGSAKADSLKNVKPVEKGCPHDCGLCSDHIRQTCCVLLEVTSRCNLTCPVCFASANEGERVEPDLAKIRSHYKMLMASGGPYNIQLSGGEPTLRDDLPDIIKIGKEEGFTFFQLNTNGLRLAHDPEYLMKLRDAGLNCVFLQFDGLTETPYRILRGKDLLRIKLKAIDNCKASNVGVVLVPTVVRGVNDGEMGDLIRFAADRLPYIRGVHFQPASVFGRYALEKTAYRLTIPRMLSEIERQTGGKMKKEDFSGGGAEHSHCSFHASFMIAPDGGVRALKFVSQGCCDASSARSRDSVARQWTLKEQPSRACGNEPEDGLYSAQSFDAFLESLAKRTLTVSGMLFQDAYTLELDRVKQCYICEVSKDGALVPFCAYNLTDASGRSLYRS